MCGRQPGPKSPNLKKVWEEAFHPFRKRHTALRRSNEIGNKLFAQVIAEEWVIRIQVNVPSEGRRFRLRPSNGILSTAAIRHLILHRDRHQFRHPLAPNSLKRDTASRQRKSSKTPQKPRREGPSSISFCPSFPIQGARAIRNRNILCCNVFPIPSECSAPPCSFGEAPAPRPCAAGCATRRPAVSTSAEYSRHLAEEADTLSTHSHLHSQTMLPPLA